MIFIEKKTKNFFLKTPFKIPLFFWRGKVGSKTPLFFWRDNNERTKYQQLLVLLIKTIQKNIHRKVPLFLQGSFEGLNDDRFISGYNIDRMHTLIWLVWSLHILLTTQTERQPWLELCVLLTTTLKIFVCRLDGS